MNDRKMLKRRILPLLAAGAIAMLSACGQQPVKKTDTGVFMKEEGIRLTQRMGELGASNEYMQAMGGPGSLKDQAQAIGGSDYGTPETVYVIDISNDFALRFLNLGDKELPPEIAQEIRRRMNGAVFANLINGTYGAETIATTNMLACGQDYQEPAGWQGDTLLVLKYGGDYSSMISFMSSGEGIIEASASFVKNGEEDVVEQLSRLLSMDPSVIKKMD